MKNRVIKKSIILSLFAGILSVGFAKCEAPSNFKKLPATSPMKKPGVDKDKIDKAKPAIAQVEALRDANSKEAVMTIARALRAIDAKIDKMRRKTIRRKRKRHMGKDADKADKKADRAAKKEAKAK